MTHLPHIPPLGAATCSAELEEKLNLYVDGELPFAEHPHLFAHLAVCSACRHSLDSTLKFRRMSRQEHLVVPPGVDEVFFKRLDRQRRTSRRFDRAADRRPLWQARTRLSVRGAVVVAVLVFITGLLMPVNAPAPSGVVYVEGRDQRVEFPEAVEYRAEPVYVFYPGLTVEAPKLEAETETL